MKHALLRIGAVGMASAVTAVVLLGLGRLIVMGDLGIAMPSLSAGDASPSPSSSPTFSPAVLSDLAAPSPSPAPEPSRSQTASPTEAPLALTSFRFGGHGYVGIVVPEVGRTFAAPFAGTVEIRTYQLIDG